MLATCRVKIIAHNFPEECLFTVHHTTAAAQVLVLAKLQCDETFSQQLISGGIRER